MNILIVRLGALGDVVHAVPAVAALRKAYPAARIDWLVEARHRAIVGDPKGHATRELLARIANRTAGS